ncbi:hypothetical protein PQE74_gp155 [Bacillus phage vB_BanS_Chewbecca]|uniref:Lipoprotein n=1 Tax=Bacillus phage vB_BanS_Chewbecca TaxID=2894786 RepID=A0AAE8YNA2_9CAUD|nr:hypothetical protein PQE74_gp155 [Bacillus phage vB_BanS_Chewbecca]UGO46238.1 hypothetical protein CHEWBECCA_155 [Bacillus phage vB_BanS_Chewbecca]
MMLMKKSLPILLTMMMAFGMVGCGGVPQNNSNIEQNESDCDLDDLYEGDEDCGFSKKKKKTSTKNGVVSTPKTSTTKPSTKPSTKSSTSTPKVNISKPSTSVSRPSTPSRSK